MLLGELPGLPEKPEPMFGVPRPAAEPPWPWQRPLTVDSDLRTATWEGRSVPAVAARARRALLPAGGVGHTWPFADLHHQVWGNAHLGDRSDVQSVVKRLRRKLRDLGCPPRSWPSAAWVCGWSIGVPRPTRPADDP